MYTGWKSFALTFALICVAGCCTANREIGRLASAVKDSPSHEEALRYASAIRGVILRIGNEGGERELDSALFRVFMASSFFCMFSSGSAAGVRVYSLRQLQNLPFFSRVERVDRAESGLSAN